MKPKEPLVSLKNLENTQRTPQVMQHAVALDVFSKDNACIVLSLDVALDVFFKDNTCVVLSVALAVVLDVSLKTMLALSNLLLYGTPLGVHAVALKTTFRLSGGIVDVYDTLGIFITYMRQRDPFCERAT